MKKFKIINFISIILFFLFLSIPFIQMELRIFPEMDLSEKRKLEKRPDQLFHFHSLKGFKFSLANFTVYFDDNFGFRNFFVYLK